MSRHDELRQMVQQETDACILWHGAVDPSGYGALQVNGRRHYCHRMAWQISAGRPVPPGHQVDHLCMTKLCVNPAHLEAVTPKVNTHRAMIAQGTGIGKRHCPAGHPYDAENTRARPRGSRECRTCERERDRLRYRRKKELVTS